MNTSALTKSDAKIIAALMAERESLDQQIAALLKRRESVNTMIAVSNSKRPRIVENIPQRQFQRGLVVIQGGRIKAFVPVTGPVENSTLTLVM
jgi:hypothetical protein